MSQKTFKIILVACGLLILLSATEIPGAVLGFFIAITVAFFVAPAAFGLQAIASRTGIEIDAVDMNNVIAALLALYCFLVLGLLLIAWRRFRQGNFDMARDRCARGALLLSLGISAWFSTGALTDAWP